MSDDQFVIDHPIESETDIIFAIASILDEAEDNGIDPEEAKQQALGYVKGRMTDRTEE